MLRELSFCLRDFLWQQKRYRQSPSSSAAWSPNSPPAPGMAVQRPSSCSVLPTPLWPVQNHPAGQGPTYPCLQLLLPEHLTFPPPAASHPHTPDLQWEEIDLTADSAFFSDKHMTTAISIAFCTSVPVFMETHD